MIPERHSNKDFEKVKTGELVNGEIVEIKYDTEHVFKWQGKETKQIGVRIIFKLDGCQYNHGTPWLKFNYSEKSNIYKKFLSKLVEGAKPDMLFDLDLLKGMKIKTLWSDNGDYQNLDSVIPAGKKLTYSEPSTEHEDAPEEEHEDEESISF